jgi:kanamycin nucleotidyltransferase
MPHQNAPERHIKCHKMTRVSEEINLISKGPKAQDRSARQNHLDGFVEKLHALYPGHVLAIALYGSMARNQDGPYSDIEVFCIVDIPEMDTTFEWIYGDGKAEINVYGLEVARELARQVADTWSLEKGQFLKASWISGDLQLLEELSELALSATDEEIKQEVRSITIGELYEWIGKLRNMSHTGDRSGLPLLACKFAEKVALVLGLAYRKPYSTGMRLLEESLHLPELPKGYERLCNLVMAGRLADPEEIRQAMEETWQGTIDWERERGIGVVEQAWPS